MKLIVLCTSSLNRIVCFISAALMPLYLPPLVDKILSLVASCSAFLICIFLASMSLSLLIFKLPENSRWPMWRRFPARQEGDRPEEDVHQQRPSSKHSGQFCSLCWVDLLQSEILPTQLSVYWNFLKITRLISYQCGMYQVYNQSSENWLYFYKIWKSTNELSAVIVFLSADH